MTKDNLLFALLGLVLGFVMASLMYERIALRQPPRLSQDQIAAVMSGQAVPGPGSTPSAAAPPSGAPPAQGGPPIDLSRLEALQQQMQNDPRNPDLILALAHESYDIAKQVPNPAGSQPLWQQARDLYSQYIQLRPDDPNLPDVLSDLGVSYQELGDYDQALEQFRRAHEMAPDHWQSLFNQAFVLAFKKNDLDQAHKILEELKRLQPNNPDVQGLANAVEEQRKAA